VTDTGLTSDGSIRLVEIHDRVHRIESDDDLAVRRDRACAQPRATTRWNEAHAMLVGEPDDRLNLLGAAGKDDGGGRGLVDPGPVRAVVSKRVVVGQDLARID
jgi:hypothetical protein